MSYLGDYPTRKDCTIDLLANTEISDYKYLF